MRFRVAAGVVFIGLVWSPAGAMARIPSNFVANQTLGGVSIGESPAAIKSTLGSPSGKRGVGRPEESLQWEYIDKHGSLSITYEHNYRAHKNRVIELEGRVGEFKSGRGIGTGSTLTEVKSVYPHAKCYEHMPGQVQEDEPPGCILKRPAGKLSRVIETRFYEINMGKGVEFIDIKEY